MKAAGLDDAALEKSAYRKASLRILPLIALGYGAAYIDRVNSAACEIPSNLLLYRFGARRWLARIMVTWGIVAMAMVFVRTPTQFYIGRFALGIVEAGFFPGVIFYVSEWFPIELRARSISRCHFRGDILFLARSMMRSPP